MFQFKLMKKKYTQQDLRRMLSETKAAKQQQAETSSKRIDSPLARYNEAGQLTCALCRSVVRSEAVWKVHINSKQHKENIEQAKKLKEQTASSAKSAQQPSAPVVQKKSAPEPTPAVASFKRPASPTTSRGSASDGSKKLKGILKNSSQQQSVAETGSLPADFFDSGTTINKNLVNIRLPIASGQKEEAEEPEAPASEPTDEEKLPEGFFDDPKADAKARNIEYKDPNDEEWDRFQKEIKEATSESLAIISEEQEESTVERQIGEIDEQIRNWSRVLSLEKKKEQVRYKTASALEAGQKMVQVKKEKQADSDDEGDDADFDEFPDWRAKKSFK